MICLDTNAVIAAVNRRSPPTLERLSAALAQGVEVAISSVVWFELKYGIAKSVVPSRTAQRLNDFMASPIQILAFDEGDAEEAAVIRASLERIGRPIGSYDILIAAQARRRGAMLVTANLREFARVPDLRVEDWSGAFQGRT